MNLIEFKIAQGFRPACYGCGRRMAEGATAWADTEGPAWQAYYCGPCAARLRARTLAYQMADERDAEIMCTLSQMTDERRINPRII